MSKQFQMLDAQAALGFVVSQSSHIEREVMAIPYPEIRYAEMVPVDTSANPFAASVTFFTQDAVGRCRRTTPTRPAGNTYNPHKCICQPQ